MNNGPCLFKGWDLIRDEADPMDICDSYPYGTFLAGVIAGNDTSTGFLGAAPGASLRSCELSIFKKYFIICVSHVLFNLSSENYLLDNVFTCDGDTNEVIVLWSLIMAVLDKSDIILVDVETKEQGSPQGLLAYVASKIAQVGIAVISPVGDNGSEGAYGIESPAVGSGVIAVGSSGANGFVSTFSSKGLSSDLNVRY